jgi:hypothetical protein
MPTTSLRLDRDDSLESAPEGWLGSRDPPASTMVSADPGSYEVLLDETVVGVLADYQSVRVEVEPGDHVLETRVHGSDPVICTVPFTAEAESNYATTTHSSLPFQRDARRSSVEPIEIDSDLST